MLKWDTRPPYERVPFRVHDAPSFRLHLEPGLDLGAWLEVRLRRFPPRALTLDWDNRMPSAIGG